MKRQRKKQRRSSQPWQVLPLLLLQTLLPVQPGSSQPGIHSTTADSPGAGSLNIDHGTAALAVTVNATNQQHPVWPPANAVHKMQPESDDAPQQLEQEATPSKHASDEDLQAVVGDSESPDQVAAAPHYHSEHGTVQLWLQLCDINPSSLPPDLQEQLRRWLGVMPAGMVVYMRPPGVLLCLHLLVPKE
jgi:hypothetical protein